MTAPAPQLHPADLWESLVQHGLSEADATRHVMLAIRNQPEAVRQQYLQDVDPGKLASFGLGAADMTSFGLGDQAARALWGQEATDTQQAAETVHPTAHLAGEIAGVLTPLAAEKALALAGVRIAPTAISAAVRGIKSTVGRAAAKTALNAAVGASYAGAQAAGRTEGGLVPRLQAAKQAAPYGAAVGVAAPWIAGTIGAAGSKFLGPIAKRVAGAAPAEAPAGLLSPKAVAALEARIAEPLGGPLEDISAAARDLKLGKITQADFDMAMQTASQQMQRPGLLAPSAPALEAPAFTRGTTPMTVEEVQGRAGIPTRAAQAEAAQIRGRMEQLGKGRVQPYYPRGGQAEQTLPPPGVQSAPVIGPASPEVVVRQSSYAQLMQALGNPQTLPRVRQAILGELQRRGIVGAGLLAPAMTP